MDTQTIEYNGKTLRYFRSSSEGVKFHTEDFFNILGTGIPDTLISGEFVTIEYQMAIVYADQHNEDFADWLRAHFQDDEIGSFITGK
jgi:hypothetical protein